jgi:tetratricopeptide (TPR) repeat protein
MVNYYSALELTPSASQAEIKAAFKKLAVKYHPDKNPDNPEMEERFKEVNHAYQILSNPYEKARYDLQFAFGETFSTSYYTPPTPKTPPPTYPRYRRQYAERKIDWKENWIATGYAFAFTFVVAAIVMTGITIKNYIDAKKHAELLLNRRTTFTQAKLDYSIGKMELSLSTLNNLGVFMEGEEDMLQFKEDALNKLIFDAQHHYNLGKFKDAIFYFELIENYGPNMPLIFKQNLAYAYRKVGQPGKSLKTLTELLLLDYHKLELSLEKAEIFKYDLENYEEAQRYYELASELAIKRYIAMFGEAYPLIINSKSIGPEHFRIYTGLASVYLHNGDFEKTIKATNWNKRMWPDSLENFVMAHEANLALGKNKLACENYWEAISLGAKISNKLNCR